MQRRQFIKSTTGLTAGGLIPGIFSEATKAQYPELDKHKISHTEVVELNYHWPRFVGKNGRIDFHGQDKKLIVLKIHTDQGAMGWGLSQKEAENHTQFVSGKAVGDLIQPGTGILASVDKSLDFALHDLMGIILDKPVYQLLDNKGTKANTTYSGMIYLDELNPENKTKGIDAILENCAWDYDYGYRQLKVKIGRSGRWYPHEAGLAKDIEVVKAIYDAFRDRQVEILVDSNDMYSLDDTKAFLKGIGDIPLFWVEEPFTEDARLGRELRQWMNQNGFERTYYADGEARPQFELCMEMASDKVLDVYLEDIYGLGFTNWMKLGTRLRSENILASPHAWGNMLKTHYICHYAAAYGGVPTIEGVTCLSDDIDFGTYPLVDGKKTVSDAPGFGMSILK